MKIRTRWAVALAAVLATVVASAALVALLTTPAPEPVPTAPVSPVATEPPAPPTPAPVQHPAEPTYGAEHQGWTNDAAREAERRLNELAEMGPGDPMFECLQNNLWEDCQ